jgi:hypothetical protein
MADRPVREDKEKQTREQEIPKAGSSPEEKGEGKCSPEQAGSQSKIKDRMKRQCSTTVTNANCISRQWKT